MREALYLLTTLVALKHNPAFLLVDVGATVRYKGKVGGSGYSFLALYVLAPEKFVAVAALHEGGLGWEIVVVLALLGGALLDLCGVGALIAGLAAGSLPGALAVGYAATTLGALWVIALVVADQCFFMGICRFCCCYGLDCRRLIGPGATDGIDRTIDIR